MIVYYASSVIPKKFAAIWKTRKTKSQHIYKIVFSSVVLQKLLMNKLPSEDKLSVNIC